MDGPKQRRHRGVKADIVRDLFLQELRTLSPGEALAQLTLQAAAPFTQRSGKTAPVPH